MGRGSFLLGILLIWLALSVGELYRIRIELPRRPKTELGLSSLMVGMTDLAAALVVGAIGWARASDCAGGTKQTRRQSLPKTHHLHRDLSSPPPCYS